MGNLEKFEETTKGVIRSCRSKKDRQMQWSKDKRTNNYLQNKDRATRLPTNSRM